MKRLYLFILLTLIGGWSSNVIAMDSAGEIRRTGDIICIHTPTGYYYRFDMAEIPPVYSDLGTFLLMRAQAIRTLTPTELADCEIAATPAPEPTPEPTPTPDYSITPNIPSSLAAGTLTPTSVSLFWTDNSNNEQGFLIQRDADLDDVTRTYFTIIGDVGADTVEFTDATVTSGKTYRYRVLSYNQKRSEYSTTIIVVVP